MKALIQNILGIFDIRIIRESTFKKLMENSGSAHDIELLDAIEPESRSRFIDLLEKSKSQIRQDLFVLSELGFKENGYFVEFGATNGVDISNSHLLEKEFLWDGILAEPAQVWHAELKQNRSAIIETRCVWEKSGQILKFNETPDSELSTIDIFSEKDKHSRSRKSGRKYDVETISLLELLETHNAPRLIDYLSMDTEGSEYEILKNFDFDRYQFNVITCEHNNTPNREKIHDLLLRNGYQRKFESISKFDDWYVRTGS